MMDKFIFLHIIKCGGTSLRYALLDQFGYDRTAPVPLGSATGSYAYPVLRNVNPLVYQATVTPEMMQDYQLVMSHYDWRIADRLPEWNVITMFRHPVQQLHSLFRYKKTNHDLQVMHANMQHMSFMEWIMSDKARPFLNTQTRYLSAHGAEDVRLAVRHLLDRRLTFGILERFEDSIKLFNEKFGWSLQVRHDNRNSLQRELTDEEITLAEKLQGDDMQLYRIASGMFDAEFQGW